MKRILLVRPKPVEATIGLQHLMIVEPLELEILGTLIKHKYEVRIIDMILEDKPLHYFLTTYKPHVLCITGYITHVTIIKQYSEIAKKIDPSIILITGGVHVEKYPEDVDFKTIDFRVVRNATKTFLQLLDYLFYSSEFPNGVLSRNQILNEKELPDFDFYVPIPDRSLTAKYRSKYFYVFHDKVALLKTSFGCPFTCKFCFCREITNGLFYARPITDVMDELETINEKEIYIVDDDFLLSRKRVLEFINELEKRNLQKRFLVYGRADFIVNNPDVIKEFKKHGLRTIIVGLESFNEIELKDFDKKTTVSLNRQALQVLNKYGVDCYAAIIVSPNWTKQDFKSAAKEMRRLKLKFINLQPLTPLKGIELQVNEDDLVIKRTDYAKWDLAHVSIQPKHMSVGEYYTEILELYERVTFDPRHLLSHMKHPIRMQLKLLKGMKRVHKQYKMRISETR